jgi:hypothetical protein
LGGLNEALLFEILDHDSCGLFGGLRLRVNNDLSVLWSLVRIRNASEVFDLARKSFGVKTFDIALAKLFD